MADSGSKPPSPPRFIAVHDLAPGFDAADLIASGVTGPALIAWLKDRVRPLTREGIPAPAAPLSVRAEKKERAAAPEEASGPQVSAPVKASTSKPTAPAPISSNVTPIAAARKPQPAADIDVGLLPRYSEDALSSAYQDAYADELIHVEAFHQWMRWDGARWAKGGNLFARNAVLPIVRAASDRAANDTELGKKSGTVATALLSARTVASVEQLARGKMLGSDDQWDRDVWLLNTPGGTVDLRTGELRPHRRTDYCTKVTSVTPGGDCPRWLKFMDEVTQGDKELAEYMQRIAGYFLTGDTREQALFFLYGGGGNGKSIFLNTLQTIMHDYATTANMDVFLEQKFSKHSTDIASLAGARLVTASEIEANQYWAESQVKQLTGDEVIKARFMRENNFEFRPQFKLLIAGNNRPRIKVVDDAIKRRLNIIPFLFKPAVPDLQLKHKLAAEAAGILQWMIEGCQNWIAYKLTKPAVVQKLTSEYLDDQDTFQQFLMECTVTSPGLSIRTGVIYREYSDWMKDRGQVPLSMPNFAQEMARKGFERFLAAGYQKYRGIGLRAEGQQDPAHYSMRENWPPD
jgi:putative DNA primase/helicase